MNQRIYLQLGRAGDVCNILPLAYADAQSGKRSAIMVAKEFGGLLDGCTYVDQIVFDGSMGELDRAIKYADGLSKNVKVAQLTGPYDLIKQVVVTRNGAEYRTTTESFLKDHWNLCGRLADWKLQIPLVFDNRDSDREAALIKEHIPDKNKKLILVHANGISSPFPHRELLLELLRLKFASRYDILDLSTVKAEKFYDLLGIFEHKRVHCLVAIDSAPLHLAYASKSLPVAALVNDTPSLWHGSVWRPNHISHIRYREFPARAVEMLEAINKIGRPGSWFAAANKSPKIIHVWSEYERNGEAIGKEWAENERWVLTPLEVGAVGHDSKHSRVKGVRDKQRYPFVKDAIRIASLRAGADDVICLTRANSLPHKINSEYLLSHAPCYSHRLVKYNDERIEHHPAVDLFAFTKAWWQKHQVEYPDMIMGRDPHWHRILKEVIVKNGGKELHGAVVAYPPKSNPATVDKIPDRVLHNERLANEFLKKHNISCSATPISEQVELEPLNHKALFQFGYNPSIIRYGNKLLMAYRHHNDTGDASTSLAMAELDDRFNPVMNERIEVSGVMSGMSIDDPRLFLYDGDLYCCYVVSTWPKNPPQCTVRYGKIAKIAGAWTIPESFSVNYGNNFGAGMEKNWVPFEHGGRLYFIYHNQPEQIVIQVMGDVVINEYKSPTPNWVWGRIHAGTTPIPGESGMVRFFHTRLDNEPPPSRWRYYMGACLMEPEPPFRITAVCREPILRGSEEDDTTVTERASCIHRKQNVIFPAGAMWENNRYMVSAGVNDCRCVIASVTDLKL